MKLSPDTFTEGGLLADVDVTVKEAAFVMFDYGGQSTKGAVPCLGLTLVDPDGKEHDQYFSCGDPAYFKPSKTGLDNDPAPDGVGPYLSKVGDKAGLNNNTNGAKFIVSLINSGFPQAKLELGDVSILTGLNFHLRREAVQRSGLVRTGKNAQREQQVVVCAKINRLPWEQGTGIAKHAAAQAAATPAPATATAAKANGSGDDSALREQASQVVMELLLEVGEAIPKTKLATLGFSKLKADPNKVAISKLLIDDTFLKSVSGVSFDKGIVSLA